MSLTPSQSFGTELRARFRVNSSDATGPVHLDYPHSEPLVRNLRNRRGSSSSKVVLSLAVILASITVFIWFVLSPPVNSVNSRFSLSGGYLLRISQNTVGEATQGVKPVIPTSEKIPKPFPVVDRSILDRLEGSGRSLKKAELASYVWPPVVTRIPEPVAGSVPPIPSKPLCFQGPCRLLLPMKLAEQESKARMHLSQLIVLAKKLNRTMVLPRVGKSRLGACLRWKFDLYYDLEGLRMHGYDVVTMDRFEEWFEERRQPISSVQRLHLKSKANSPSDAIHHRYFTLFPEASFSPPPKCLSATFSGAVTTLPAIVVHPKEGEHPPIADDIVQALRQDPPLGFDADILAVDWNLRYPLLPFTSVPTIDYSPELYHLSEQLAPSSPYLMVHWRMENVAPEVFPDCALALVNTLSNILNHPVVGAEIKTIWFASDHPMPLSSQNCSSLQVSTDNLSFPKKSSTFTQLRENHAEALRIVRDAFCGGGELEGWDVTDLTGALERASPISEFGPDKLADSGVLGILDKIVGVKAAVFVSGSKKCAKKSSFTKQIVDMRREEESKRNLVEYFG
ncbi:hypothetical protein AAF712_005185 [Marasmius tenuissimus]|uniref:Uncharacterized protein n=1 Tax=Marasmius tenuissimus TaxID=585030 RepID=A0ABR3A2P2_9AGAR